LRSMFRLTGSSQYFATIGVADDVMRGEGETRNPADQKPEK